MKPQQREDLLRSLKRRFEKHMQRHKGIAWAEVQARLDGNPVALESLRQMEATGGEPDVIGQDMATGRFTFCDCAAESPAGRRSLCYDRKRWTHERNTSPRAARSRWPRPWASSC